MAHLASIVALSAAVAIAFAIPSLPAREEADWKYSVGWDGKTLPATAIGDSIGTNGTSLDKRTIGGIYICTDINWGGRCGYAVQETGACIVLGSDWNKQISSFGPDECTTCMAATVNDCYFHTQEVSGTTWWFSNPGDATGGIYGSNPWNDQISSFVCYATCNTYGPINERDD